VDEDGQWAERFNGSSRQTDHRCGGTPGEPARARECAKAETKEEAVESLLAIPRDVIAPVSFR
jgi:hypothetical protein